MKQQVKIVIKGQEYPCRLTLGAMRRFKRMTGKDVTTLTEGDVDDMVTLIYCCTKSACGADGVAFALTIDDFADCLELDCMRDFVQEVASGQENAEKKTVK